MNLKTFEEIKLDLKVGDTLLGGRYKNHRIKVKKIGKDDKGQVTVNDKPLLKFRIWKDLPAPLKAKHKLKEAVQDEDSRIELESLLDEHWKEIKALFEPYGLLAIDMEPNDTEDEQTFTIEYGSQSYDGGLPNKISYYLEEILVELQLLLGQKLAWEFTSTPYILRYRVNGN